MSLLCIIGLYKIEWGPWPTLPPLWIHPCSVLPSLATSIPLVEGASQCGSSEEAAKLGSKRPCAGGSGGGPLSVAGTKEVAGDETKIQDLGASVGVVQRRTAIVKRLRRSTAPTKVGAEKRKRSSSPASSSSSIRSAAPDPKRTRYKHCLVTKLALSVFGCPNYFFYLASNVLV
jgi:hypothetical protein